MVRLAVRRRLVLLVLALTLLAPWSAQAFPLGSPPAEPFADLASRLTEWITALFGDVGCSWDPGGGCRDTNVPTDQLDVGCSWDPSGRCRETTGSQLASPDEHLDIGCSWDPNGGSCHR